MPPDASANAAVETSRPAATKVRVAAVYVLVFWSGYFVMALELLGARSLGPYFGTGIHVWGAVISLFMLSLSLGYLLGGALSVAIPDLRGLAGALLASTVAALPAVFASEPILLAVHEVAPDPRYGALLAAFVLYFLPVGIAGAVSPYAIRLLVDRLGTSGRVAGRVFFVSTLGSTLGTLFTSFHLVLWFDVDQILFGMVAISLAVAAFGFGIARGVAAAILAAMFLLPADAAAQGTAIARERSLYRDITIYESNGLRCMRFGIFSLGPQSCQALADKDTLVLTYARMMMGALYLNPKPERILMIGLGGGTLAEALAKLHPDAKIDLVELDPAVIRAAETHFGLDRRRYASIVAEDGRVYVRRAAREGKRYDLVLLDAFDENYVPEHMLTREYFVEVRALLAPGGVMAVNSWSTSRLANAETATFQAALGRFYNLADSNRVVLFREGGLPDMAEIRANAAALAPALRRLGVDEAWLLARFAEPPPPAAGTRILTDRYAPANLLNAR
jgi:spermidine synthase